MIKLQSKQYEYILWVAILYTEGDRLQNLAIATGLTRNDLVQQQFIEGPLPERTKLPLSPGVRTQFIELQIRNDTPNFFHICEVIVHGDFVRDGKSFVKFL